MRRLLAQAHWGLQALTARKIKFIQLDDTGAGPIAHFGHPWSAEGWIRVLLSRPATARHQRSDQAVIPYSPAGTSRPGCQYKGLVGDKGSGFGTIPKFANHIARLNSLSHQNSRLKGGIVPHVNSENPRWMMTARALTVRKLRDCVEIQTRCLPNLTLLLYPKIYPSPLTVRITSGFRGFASILRRSREMRRSMERSKGSQLRSWAISRS